MTIRVRVDSSNYEQKVALAIANMVDSLRVVNDLLIGTRFDVVLKDYDNAETMSIEQLREHGITLTLDNEVNEQ